MTRRWIPLDKLVIFDHMHFQVDGGWGVDAVKDGQTKAQHVEGIEYIKGLMQKGAKIRPILVQKVEDEDQYIRLDGFKRCIAHQEMGLRFIEAFVCSEEEVRRQQEIPYLDNVLICTKGGQLKERYPSVVEGYEQEGEFKYSEQVFLYKDDAKPHGLRIEVSESIHVHWGEFGRYRLGLGRRDFEQLARAISKI